jgi:lysophospholipase L1-like esterase
VDIQSAVNGVRVHKLGSSGSKATDWLNANATQWQAGISSLAPNLVILCLGTNDQASYTAKVFQGHIENMVARIRAAAPTADILLMCPCENQGGRANPMATYAGAMRYNASVYGTAFLDLQPAFGLLPADYAFGSARPWFQADGFHPEPTTGGYAIAAALLRLLRPE